MPRACARNPGPIGHLWRFGYFGGGGGLPQLKCARAAAGYMSLASALSLFPPWRLPWNRPRMPRMSTIVGSPGEQPGRPLGGRPGARKLKAPHKRPVIMDSSDEEYEAE